MKVKMILPALTAATSPFWRPIKYSLFPPPGLATLADPRFATALFDGMRGMGRLWQAAGRSDASRFTTGISNDTRHAVFRPARMSAGELEAGYRRAYRDFYRWGSILRGARAHGGAMRGLRHAAYAAGWKKFEPCWGLVIRAKRAGMMLPVLETILTEFGKRGADASTSAVDRHEILGAAAKHTDRLGVEAGTRTRRSPCTDAARDAEPLCIPCSRSS